MNQKGSKMDFKKLLSFRDENNAFPNFIGLKTIEVKKGYARGELVIRKKHKNIINSVHGGCLYSLADNVGGTAAASHGFCITTISGSMNFLSPGIDVEKLIATAKEIKYGKKICVYNIEIEDEIGKLLAQGVFSYFKLNKKINLD